MKKTFLIVNFLLGTSLFAQINFEDSSVQIKPSWELNKLYTYKFTDKNISISVNDTTMNITNNSSKSIKLIDKNNFAYKLELVNGKNTTNDPDEFYRDFINNSGGIKYQYTTNQSGEFLELLNADEVETSFLKITDALGKQKKKSKEYKDNIHQIEEMIKSKTYIPYVFDQEIQVVNYFNGHYLKLGETYLGKSVQENIFGFPISSTTTTYLKTIDPDKETFTVVSDQKLSTEDFEKLWEEMAYYMLNDTDLKADPRAGEAGNKKYSETVELKVAYESTYDKNAILLQSDYIFSLNIGSKKTVNHLAITLLDK